ncbi:MAG: UDP-N-acetylmuramyl-tripeptide synthetase, partial [Nanoarchaeota archaeon]|nr:UDP-N-acetylmuramyl-tripeptide synthetase [Nanoarchaeota archaeon]
MERVFFFLKKIIPSRVFCLLQSPYHFALAWLADVWYGMPSRRMYVIGVTGTKGKTTTANLLADILGAAGRKTGVTSSVYFRFGSERIINDTKQGMPGRFYLQKLLAEMVRKGCTHAVVETTSEGMIQHRHRFIDYNAAVFTNLTPEHIERHGSFEKYRDTKVKLFEKVARKKPFGAAQDTDGIGVYNLDDGNVGYFLKPKVPTKIGFSLGKSQITNHKSQINSKLQIQNIKLTDDGSEFDIEGVRFQIPLVGEFNVYNAVAAIAMARTLGVSLEMCAEILRDIKPLPGRFEVIKVVLPRQSAGQDDNHDFVVIVDYAHEPKSLEECYKAAQLFLRDPSLRSGRPDGGRVVCLLGSQGGGRDKWKRPEMGRVAARYCDEIVLTNEDPYDEIPLNIINDIEEGISSQLKVESCKLKAYKIIDRKEAIRKAIFLAGPGDVVILTGKGGEVWMCLEN